MPPLPRSCAAIIRSAFRGPAKMRKSPIATNASRTAAAPKKKSRIESTVSQSARKSGFIFLHLPGVRLVDIEGMQNDLPVCFFRHGQRTGHEAARREEKFAPPSARDAAGAGDKSRAERQPRVQRSNRDVDSG